MVENVYNTLKIRIRNLNDSMLKQIVSMFVEKQKIP